LQIRLHLRCFSLCFTKCKVRKVQAKAKYEKDRKRRAIEREKLTPCGFV